MILKVAIASLVILSSSTANVIASRGGAVIKKLTMPNDINADSKLGQRLLSHARRVESGDGEGEHEGEEEEEVEWDYSNFHWVSGYSLKFQGCHEMVQWNYGADEGEDNEGDGGYEGEYEVKLKTRRLVRFRLCEASTCSDGKTDGCKKGYGDYVVDLSTFAQSYLEHKQLVDAYASDSDANGDNDADDDYFDIDNYMECARLGGEEDKRDEGEGEKEGGERRHLEDYEDEENDYYVGPYCAENGGAIYMGLFTDDVCSVFADVYGGTHTYYTLTNTYLPYGSESIVDMDCISCHNHNYVFGDDHYVGDHCGQPYARAGKCEEELTSDVVGEQNNAACSYIEGIRNEENGIVVVRGNKANIVATSCIIFFACTFFLFLYYVYLLRKKLGRKNILLS